MLLRLRHLVAFYLQRPTVQGRAGTQAAAVIEPGELGFGAGAVSRTGTLGLLGTLASVVMPARQAAPDSGGKAWLIY